MPRYNEKLANFEFGPCGEGSQGLNGYRWAIIQLMDKINQLEIAANGVDTADNSDNPAVELYKRLRRFGLTANRSRQWWFHDMVANMLSSSAHRWASQNPGTYDHAIPAHE